MNDEIIDKLKAAMPAAVLRTTLIVGFPGETESHFAHLYEFVQRHEFDHVGVFTFSPEEGTPAYNLPNQLPEAVKEDRRSRLMALQQPISLKKNQGELGKVVDVLLEQENPATGEYIGRSGRLSPEVDGLVYVQGKARLSGIVPVKITAADVYDLYGQVVGHSSSGQDY